MPHAQTDWWMILQWSLMWPAVFGLCGLWFSNRLGFTIADWGTEHPITVGFKPNFLSCHAGHIRNGNHSSQWHFSGFAHNHCPAGYDVFTMRTFDIGDFLMNIVARCLPKSKGVKYWSMLLDPMFIFWSWKSSSYVVSKLVVFMV